MRYPAINDFIQSLLSERSSLQYYQSDPLRHNEFRAQMFCTGLKELYKKMPREVGIPAIFGLFTGDEGKILQFRGNADETDDETQTRFEQSLADLLDAVNLSVGKLRSLRRQTWDSKVVDISQAGSALEILEQLILDLDDLYKFVNPSDPSLLLANDLKKSLPAAFSRIPIWDQRASSALSDFKLSAMVSELKKEQLRAFACQDSETLKTAIANRKRVVVAYVSEIAAHPEAFFPRSVMPPNRQLTPKPSKSDTTESQPSIGTMQTTEALSILRNRLDHFERIRSEMPIDEQKLVAATALFVINIREIFGIDSPEHQRYQSWLAFPICTLPLERWEDYYPQDAQWRYQEGATKTMAEIRKLVSLLTVSEEGSDAKKRMKMEIDPALVFIVHGKDVKLRESVELFLHRLGLRPVVLFREISGGKVVVEKLEHFAGMVGYAIILLNPEDIGYLKEEYNNGTKGNDEERARQNVVFEMGYFFALLGRGKVAALQKGGVTKPSDIDGIVYIPMHDENLEWKITLAKELLAAGLKVDMSQL